VPFDGATMIYGLLLLLELLAACVLLLELLLLLLLRLLLDIVLSLLLDRLLADWLLLLLLDWLLLLELLLASSIRVDCQTALLAGPACVHTNNSAVDLLSHRQCKPKARPSPDVPTLSSALVGLRVAEYGNAPS